MSCFETVTQHISGQPFCNTSMEALEMMVKQLENLLFCRAAKSGEDMDPMTLINQQQPSCSLKPDRFLTVLQRVYTIASSSCYVHA